MNIFDRSINMDALFRLSQMYVSSVQTIQSGSFSTAPRLTGSLSSLFQISFHPDAPEERVLQPGRLYVCGCRRLLCPRSHWLLSGETARYDPSTHTDDALNQRPEPEVLIQKCGSSQTDFMWSTFLSNLRLTEDHPVQGSTHMSSCVLILREACCLRLAPWR